MAKKVRDNRVPVMMTEAELEAIDDWRFRNHIATRSDAIRRLCQNGLAVHGEVDRALDEASDVWDRVTENHKRMWSIMMQSRGAHDRADPPLPPRKWTATEVADLQVLWATDLIDYCHVLYLDLLKINNRVNAVSNAPRVARGMAAARREQEAIDKEREEVIDRREAGDRDRTMSLVSLWLQASPKRQKVVQAMSEDELGRWWDWVLDYAEQATRAVMDFSDEDMARVTRTTHEPYDLSFIATFLAVHTLLDQPKRSLAAYSKLALRTWPNADPAMLDIMTAKALAEAEGVTYVGS